MIFRDDLLRVRQLYKLKNIERANSVGYRKESSAEHSWSCLILADYFLSVDNCVLDRLKVYELLLYHDLVEIEAGDVCISKEELRKQKKELELEAMQVLKEKIPVQLKEKFKDLFLEFEAGRTKEARFAKAIDALDAFIHEIDYKEDWKGWSEKFVRSKKGPLFEEFSDLKEFFEEALRYCAENGYFNE